MLYLRSTVEEIAQVYRHGKNLLELWLENEKRLTNPIDTADKEILSDTRGILIENYSTFCEIFDIQSRRVKRIPLLKNLRKALDKLAKIQPVKGETQ